MAQSVTMICLRSPGSALCKGVRPQNWEATTVSDADEGNGEAVKLGSLQD
jgi:hypothetical protein